MMNTDISYNTLDIDNANKKLKEYEDENTKRVKASNPEKIKEYAQRAYAKKKSKETDTETHTPR